MVKETEWNKQFRIGVDSIDNAHKKLFSIVRKLIHLSQDENNGQWACAEGIKYFKNYAVRSSIIIWAVSHPRQIPRK